MAAAELSLDGVEFSTLPSGLHVVDEDVVQVFHSVAPRRVSHERVPGRHITKGVHHGISVFRRRKTNEVRPPLPFSHVFSRPEAPCRRACAASASSRSAFSSRSRRARARGGIWRPSRTCPARSRSTGRSRAPSTRRRAATGACSRSGTSDVPFGAWERRASGSTGTRSWHPNA